MSESVNRIPEGLIKEIERTADSIGISIKLDNDGTANSLLTSIMLATVSGLVLYHRRNPSNWWPCIAGCMLTLQEDPTDKEYYSMTISDTDEDDSDDLADCIYMACRSSEIPLIIDRDLYMLPIVIIRSIYKWLTKYDYQHERARSIYIDFTDVCPLNMSGMSIAETIASDGKWVVGTSKVYTQRIIENIPKALE